MLVLNLDFLSMYVYTRTHIRMVAILTHGVFVHNSIWILCMCAFIVWYDIGVYAFLVRSFANNTNHWTNKQL